MPEYISNISRQDKKDLFAKAEEYLPAEIHMFAAGRVGQKSMESSDVAMKLGLGKREFAEEIAKKNKDGGATTSSLLKAFYQFQKKPAATYKQVLEEVRCQIKKAGYEHVTQLGSSRPIEETERFSILPRNGWGGKSLFTGRKRALIIGINYKGSSIELPGCQNDAWNMAKYLREVHGFQDDDMTIMMDDGKFKLPTANNIKRAMYHFCFSLQPGDAAFFHFSGHGAQLGDSQVIMPVDEGFVDKRRAEFVEDKEIFRLMLLSLPKGVKLTAVIDCCHSGHMLDLPFQWIDEGFHDDIYEPRFRHAKYVPMERMRVESMVAIKMPAADMEEMLFPPPKSWRERTLGEGWEDFWWRPKQKMIKKKRYNPNSNVTTLVVRDKNDDDRSVSSMGALDMKRKKRSKSLFGNKHAPYNTTNNNNTNMGGSMSVAPTRRNNRVAPDSDDRSVSSMGALDKKKALIRRKRVHTGGEGDDPLGGGGGSSHGRKKNNGMSLTEYTNAMKAKDKGNKKDMEDQSVASMGALDKKKKANRMFRPLDFGSGMAGLTGLSGFSNHNPKNRNDDNDDRSVSSLGALDKKKKAARRGKKESSAGDLNGGSTHRKIKRKNGSSNSIDDGGDDRSVCSLGALDKKKKAARQKAEKNGTAPSKSKSSAGKTNNNNGETTNNKPVRRLSLGAALARIGGSFHRREEKKSENDQQEMALKDDSSVIKRRARRRADNDDDGDDRSVSSTGALEKRRKASLRTKNSGAPTKKKSSAGKKNNNDDGDDRSVVSAGGGRSKKTTAPKRNASDVGAGAKQRPALKRVGSAHQLGRTATGPRRGKKHATTALVVKEEPRRKRIISDDDDDRSVSSTGALEMRRKAALRKNGAGVPVKKKSFTNSDDRSVASAGGGMAKKKHMPLRHNSVGPGVSNDDRSVGSAGGFKKKHMPKRNLSVGGGLKNAGTPLKHSPGMNRNTSAHQLGRQTAEARRGRKNETWDLNNGRPKKHTPLNKATLLGNSEHGTKSTGFDRPQKHRPGELGLSLSEHPKKNNSYLPGTLSKPAPMRKKVPKKHSSLAQSNHSTVSNYSSESTFDTSEISLADDAEDNRNGKWKKEVMCSTKSNASFMSDISDDDDASLTDDDDDEFLQEDPLSNRHTCQSIQGIRSARRRRKTAGSRNLAKANLNSALLGTDDQDPDFSQLGVPGLGIGVKPKGIRGAVARNTVR